MLPGGFEPPPLSGHGSKPCAYSQFRHGSKTINYFISFLLFFNNKTPKTFNKIMGVLF